MSLEELLLLVLIIVTVAVSVVSIDLNYWVWKQRYSHWKKKKNYSEKVKEVNIKKEYNATNPLWPEIVIALIPGINIFQYVTSIQFVKKHAFIFSSNYIIQDVCSWKKGINSLIWKKWKPKKGWRAKHPVK